MMTVEAAAQCSITKWHYPEAAVLCGCVLLTCTAAWGQDYDPLELLHRVSAKVTGAPGRQSGYSCGLTLERSQYLSEADEQKPCDGKPAGHLIETDHSKRDVAIASGTETYSWPGDNRFGPDDPYDLVSFGLRMKGYSEVLSAIFGSDAADFYWVGEKEVNGQTRVEFGFEAPQERSKYVFRSGGETYGAAYKGTFLADPATGDLVRLSIHTDGLPAESGACEAVTTLDYARLAGSPLPESAEIDIVHRDGNESRIRAVYSACRLFAGKPETPAPALPALPAGIKFTVRLTQAIDPDAASGGDQIKAALETPILDESSHEVIPRGSQVFARIIRMERFPDTNGMRLEFRLEAFETGGAMTPFKAIAGDPIPLRLKPERPQRARRPRTVSREFLDGYIEDDPSVYVLQYQDVKPGFVIKAGIRTNWVTAEP